MRPITFTYAPASTSSNAIALNQQLAGAGNLVLNGARASGGIATLPGQQIVTVTTTEDDSARTATITGKDASDNVISESMTLPSTGTKAFTKYYAEVDSIFVNGAITANMTAGVNGLGASQPYPFDVYQPNFSASVAVLIVVGATYKAQYTYDNVFDPAWPNGVQTWVDSATMTGKTGEFVDVLTAPVTAVRFVITTQASSQSLSGRIVQATQGT